MGKLELRAQPRYYFKDSLFGGKSSETNPDLAEKKIAGAAQTVVSLVMHATDGSKTSCNPAKSASVHESDAIYLKCDGNESQTLFQSMLITKSAAISSDDHFHLGFKVLFIVLDLRSSFFGIENGILV